MGREAEGILARTGVVLSDSQTNQIGKLTEANKQFLVNIGTMRGLGDVTTAAGRENAKAKRSAKRLEADKDVMGTTFKLASDP